MKEVYKKWWFWFIIAVLVIAFILWRKGYFTLGYIPLAGTSNYRKVEPSQEPTIATT